jgi:hypothetical protein
VNDCQFYFPLDFDSICAFKSSALFFDISIQLNYSQLIVNSFHLASWWIFSINFDLSLHYFTHNQFIQSTDVLDNGEKLLLREYWSNIKSTEFSRIVGFAAKYGILYSVSQHFLLSYLMLPSCHYAFQKTTPKHALNCSLKQLQTDVTKCCKQDKELEENTKGICLDNLCLLYWCLAVTVLIGLYVVFWNFSILLKYRSRPYSSCT